MANIQRSLLLLCVLLSASCAIDDSYDYPYPDPSAANYAELEVTSARLEGDMGSIEGFVGRAESIGASNSYLSLIAIEDGRGSAELPMPTAPTSPTATVVVRRRWAVMMAIGLRGVTLDDPALVPGTHLEQGTMIGNQPIALSVLGCSGPNESSWTFDRTTGDVTIDIEEGSRPDTRRANVTATWGSSTSRASFEYAAVR